MSKKKAATEQKEPVKPAAETADPVMTWVRANQKLVIGALVAIVIVVAGVWLVNETGKRRQLRAAEELDQARNTAESGNLPLAASQLQKIIDAYDGTEAATEAVVTLNQVRMVSGQSELAIVGLENYLKTNPKKVYKVPALGLLGEAYENARRPADAGAAYMDASSDAEVDYLKAQYLLSAVRAYTNAGDTTAAVNAAKTVVDTYPDTPTITEAKVRLSELTMGKMAMGNGAGDKSAKD